MNFILQIQMVNSRKNNEGECDHELENLRNHVRCFRGADGDIREARREGCQFESRDGHPRDGHIDFRVGDRHRHWRRGADATAAWPDMDLSHVVRHRHRTVLALLFQSVATWRSIQSRAVGQIERPVDDYPVSGHPP